MESTAVSNIAYVGWISGRPYTRFKYMQVSAARPDTAFVCLLKLTCGHIGQFCCMVKCQCSQQRAKKTFEKEAFIFSPIT